MKTVARLVGATVVAAGGLWASAASAGTLDDIRANGAIRIAFREDSPPFSHKAANATTPTGFMVELCQAVAAGLGKQMGIPQLKIVYVPVTSASRFDAITGSKADLLCEATTQTLKRRETLGFSIPTFADGASFMIRPTGPKDVRSMEGRKLGVLVNTTTEQDLRRALEASRIKAEVVLTKSHEEGLDAVEKGTIAAYFGDRAILTFLIKEAKTPVNLLLADTYLSVEPYALAMRRGDEAFRLAVDRELSRIYRSGEVVKIFGAAFGPSVHPSQMLQALYTTAALPE
jgi:polar amino acid transport system substrate-binding protein/glutamate/aspartate transport system substrate-binding protein